MKIEEFSGIKYYIGRSAKDNWELLDNMKNKEEKYIWFHLNSFPSPYVIMEATMKEISEI